MKSPQENPEDFSTEYKSTLAATAAIEANEVYKATLEEFLSEFRRLCEKFSFDAAIEIFNEGGEGRKFVVNGNVKRTRWIPFGEKPTQI